MSISADLIEMKLREWYRVPNDIVSECGSAVRRVSLLKSEVQMLRERIAYLEQHVPEEIAKPKPPESVYRRKSQWD